MQAADTSVRRSIVVEAPIERAFRCSPRASAAGSRAEHNILGGGHRRDGVRAARGRAASTTAGSTAASAAGRACSPTSRRTESCSAGTSTRSGRSRPILEKASEVEVRFIAEAADRTRVELEHRNLDRHGEGWEGARGALSGEGGWDWALEKFAQHVAGSHP